jgi:homeobox protein cut-like
LRGNLDEQGLAIAAAQEASVATRKRLAEKTKSFRASIPPETFKQLAPLLKSYQEEVDALTNRAKSGESAFLDLFKALYEAPDPAPCLASSLVR